MATGWMQPKIIKLRRERRAWSRPFTIKSFGPNWQNGTQYKEHPLDVTEEKIAEYEKSTRRQPIPDISEVRKNIDDPLFRVVIDNSRHRCRIFFNSRMDKFILQWVDWSKKEVRISVAYPTASRALQVWNNDLVIWRVKRSLP